MKRGLLLLLLLILVLVACSPGGGEDAGSSIPLSACRLSGGAVARCGVLTVPENRDDPGGRTIDLNIAVLPATSSTVEPDPLVLLAGGPGQAAVEAYAGALYLFDEVNKTRDIVLVDQRGTGGSNSLACANLQDAALPANLTDEETLALLDECRLILSEKADLSQYTTEIAAADLDDVRRALGYEQINLYGASYGTRAALTYMRRYPERVRSAVLDAVAGPELVLFLQMPRDGQRALDLLLERCAADPFCRDQFPDLALELDGIRARLATPQTVSVRNPLNNEPVDLELSADALMQLIFNILYSAEFQSLLPLLIHHAYETGDFTPLVAQSLAVQEAALLDLGLLYAVACSEDAPLIDPDEARDYQAGTDFPLQAKQFLEICENWPRGEVAADFRAPLQSDAPVLLLSGDADPVTPPNYAAEVVKTLPNGRHLIIPGYGHGVVAAGCMPKVVAQFIRRGAAADLDTSCLDELRPPPFFVNFAGPHP